MFRPLKHTLSLLAELSWGVRALCRAVEYARDVTVEWEEV